MKKLSLLIFCVVLATVATHAQSPAKILRDAERAMGGAKSLAATGSFYRRGRITRRDDGASGNIVITSQRPNLYNISFDLNGFEIEAGFNGRSGWTRDSRSGLRTLTGDSGLAFQTEAAFRNSLWLNAKREKWKFVFSGKAEVDGSATNVLTLTTPKGSKVRLYFDIVSKLLVREEFEAGEENSRRSFSYADHRNVGGLHQPHRVRLEIDGSVYEAVLEEVRANAVIQRSEFAFPRLSSDPLPDIPTLLNELQTNQDKVEQILDTYSYVQKRTRREMGKDGALRETGSETYQLSFYKGHRIWRVIEKDGKPLSASEQAEQDRGRQGASKKLKSASQRLTTVIRSPSKAVEFL